MNYRILRKKILKWAVLAATALVAMRLFLVQQLIAAFLIFSVLFACITAVVLIVFVLDHACQIAFAQAEKYAKAFGRAALRGWGRAEGLAMKPVFEFDRLGLRPVPRTTNSMGREGGRMNQDTHDAYVLGDMTPLSTRVAGMVRAVDVSHFPQVSEGDGHGYKPAC